MADDRAIIRNRQLAARATADAFSGINRRGGVVGGAVVDDTTARQIDAGAAVFDRAEVGDRGSTAAFRVDDGSLEL